MVAIPDEEQKKIILDRLSYWIHRMSGKPITPKKLKEIEEISNQVIEGRIERRKKYKK